MRATEALGVDGIPVSVLKKGIEVLAGPISHLVNRSLASGTVPAALKLSNVLPIYKGKSAADPASYRPVCILPALSKILETVVKTDFEIHLAKTEALPNTQFGFRRPLDHNCLTSYSCVPKLKKLGIEGMQLEWFKSYLSGGSQRVCEWRRVDFLNVKYGVRQGSILGPILYLSWLRTSLSCVGIGDEEIAVTRTISSYGLSVIP
ncbi:Putative RNA-directed DNA polymerase from transposon BS [Caligus rogercresseyi]|uniref:RNA-directed DNA polymerase from transposon BS n=1 Tax=Caligus rogercresseyi TaxID=217165 RepID=A0A7T8QU75_CALRO|nr:Putative RNA-directed DNA polymerase from transposon BS [Caligus rogercresseyi]